jgi:hypothetical protein
MSTFKIEFNDLDGNDVYSVTKTFNDLAEASKYAQTILATSSDECVDFTIYEF